MIFLLVRKILLISIRHTLIKKYFSTTGNFRRKWICITPTIKNFRFFYFMWMYAIATIERMPRHWHHSIFGPCFSHWSPDNSSPIGLDMAIVYLDCFIMSLKYLVTPRLKMSTLECRSVLIKIHTLQFSLAGVEPVITG